jgi:hypothetical protein
MNFLTQIDRELTKIRRIMDRPFTKKINKYVITDSYNNIRIVAGILLPTLVHCFQNGCYAPGYNCNDRSTACFCRFGLWPE